MSSKRTYEVSPGRAHPWGAVPDAKGVNFALFSQNATAVQLLLFEKHDSPEPSQVIDFVPETNRTFYVWHCYVHDLPVGAHYAYRVDGPHNVNQGHRFNPNKVLVDPYARGNTDALWDRVAACGDQDNQAQSMRSVVIDADDYDWEGDKPLNRPMSESIIYEMHVKGFTHSASAKVKHPGTFAGVVGKIPYLKSLGVTAVELLPVFAFDSKEILRTTDDGTVLKNYWGYSTLGFFAPESSYCTSPETGAHLREFRDMVKALHRAGIEVILDVVFNHTNEGNHLGPTINFKGIDNRVYYHLVDGNQQYYMDYSGCGNTVNCNHPVVQKFVLECLEFWVREMHVDGFRFDEGSILSRGEHGEPMEHPPVLWAIELSETLAETKVIAEAWDAAGLYQIGYFPGYRWAEWNGRYRDDIRAFVAGRPGIVGEVAKRIAGSADLYEAAGRAPVNSINFVACHDGFTSNDLVSYNDKHNDANGESGRDGNNDNISYNCGVEGPTDRPEIVALRNRQVKNFATILLVSEGVPMILGGDEFRRTQAGNNNAYCQDNELSWYDWTLTEKHADVLRFFSKMIALRKEHPTLKRRRFFSGDVNPRGLRDISWHGCNVGSPGWDDPSCRVLAFTLGGQDDEEDIHVILNMDDQRLPFELPQVPGRAWHRLVDTAQETPNDFVEETAGEPAIADHALAVHGRSCVVLLSRDTKKRA